MTDDKQYTPGPWTWEYKGNDGYDCMTDAICIGQENEKVTVNPISKMDLTYYGQVSCTEPKIDHVHTAMANASLIAAAPELLEALEGLAAYANESKEQNTPEFMEGLFEHIQASANVIAKAKGQNQ